MSEPERGSEDQGRPLSDRETYNVITDTVSGVNVRLKDNVIQGITILVCLLLGAGIGALVFEERLLAAWAGAFVGLLVGLFASGTFLMIYRAARHMRGKHD